MSGAPVEYTKVDVLKPGFRNVNVFVKVVSVEAPRTIFSRRDQAEHRVAEALVGDETGSILLTLWDDQVDAFGSDDVLEIKNGYTSLFKGSLRLNIGRYGTVEKAEKEIGEVNTGNNLSERRYEETMWSRPYERPFRRRRPRY